MKKIIILTFLILLSNSLYSKFTPELLFSKLFSGDNYELIRSVVADDNGNIYITGVTSSSNLPVTSDAFQKIYAGREDIFFMKLNPDGEIIYCSYYGLSGQESAFKIELDRNGNVWIVGQTNSSGLGTSNAFQENFNGGIADGFILKLDKKFNIEYFTYSGGRDYEAVLDIAFDDENNGWFAGQTQSSDFQATSNAPQKQKSAGFDGFIGKISNNLELKLLTLHGGNGSDKMAEGIVIKSNGNPIIAGWGTSTDMEMKNSFQPIMAGVVDAYVAEFDKETGVVINNSYIGSDDNDRAYNLAIDEDDNIYISGFTESDNFPLKNNKIDQSNNRGGDLFISKINKDWDLVWSSKIGGSATDGKRGNESFQGGLSISDNKILLSAQVSSVDFPITSNALQQEYGGGSSDAIICIVENEGDIVYSSYLGGDNIERGVNTFIDKDGNFLLCGETLSTDFPVKNSNFSHQNYYDAFLVKFAKTKPEKCEGTSFALDTFKSGDNIKLTNDAVRQDEFIRLTNTYNYRKGGLWAGDRVHVVSGFETSFDFRFSNGSNFGLPDGSLQGADGLAFVIQNNERIYSGGYGGNIAFAGIPNSFAVEIDTYNNKVLGYSDPDGNHLAVFCNGKLDNIADHKSDANLGTTSDIPIIQDSIIYTCRIVYAQNIMKIYLNEADANEKLILELADLDLTKLMDFSEYPLPNVGIVSSTGNATENHDILSWDYCGALSTDFWSVGGEDDELSVYPNPAEDYLFINDLSGYNYLEINDLTGRVVYSNQLNFQSDLKIDISKFASGAYVIKLKSSDNIKVTKFLKK